jgi:hypothetical protein
MSGLMTNSPVLLICSDGGMDVETYKSELDCVLAVINNGRLGKGINPRAAGWGSNSHAEAVQRVIDHAQQVAQEIEVAQLKEAQSAEPEGKPAHESRP